VQAQASPSLDGMSAKFSLAGATPYSNELYWSPFGGGNNVSHFTYDLYFYISDGSAPQALEFDVIFGRHLLHGAAGLEPGGDRYRIPDGWELQAGAI
jgi:hypothetical protein